MDDRVLTKVVRLVEPVRSEGLWRQATWRRIRPFGSFRRGANRLFAVSGPDGEIASMAVIRVDSTRSR